MPLLVVLVRTHNPGNLGAAARAAKNFGAELVLLDPQVATDHVDALSWASGAEDLLRKVGRIDSWEELERHAPADAVVALTSLRGRKERGLPPILKWSAVRAAMAAGHRVAFVFGPERGGLTTEELRRCDARLTIPADPAFPTLNLAQSVAVALALSRPLSPLFPFEAPRRRRGSGTRDDEEPAPSRDVARLFFSLRSTLATAGYPGRGHSKEVLAEIESFLRRGRPTKREVTLLLGALAAVRRRTGGSRRDRPSDVQ
jgi:TrmH family RNA methyltransferase